MGTEWTKDRFGRLAETMDSVAARALADAHAYALAADAASGLDSADAYGSTMYVQQHEQLIHAARELDGVVPRKPTGVRGRFAYLVIEETNVVVVPWRFSSDQRHDRLEAKFRTPMSELRRNLLSLSVPGPPRERTFDDLLLEEEMGELWVEEEAQLNEQLAKLGRVVFLAFGSNSARGIFEQGWGEVELVDDQRGSVEWRNWSPIAPAAGAVPVREAGVVADAAATTVERFDNASAETKDEFGLALRHPLSGPATSEFEDTDSDISRTEEP